MKNSYKVLRSDSQKLISAINNPQENTCKEEMDFLYKIILHNSDSVNFDITDVMTILGEAKNTLLINIYKSETKNVEKLLHTIIMSEIIDYNLQSKFRGVFVCFKINSNFSIPLLSGVMNMVYNNLHEDAVVIFGTKNDISIAINEIEIMIIISYM